MKNQKIMKSIPVTVSLFVFLSIFLPNTWCQNDNTDFYQKDKVGITLSSLANVYQGVQFNFAKGINQNMDFNTELGYIFNDDNLESCNGYRIRIQPRFRLSNDPTKYKMYVSPLIQFRYTNSTVENIFSRHNGAYYEQIKHAEVNKMFSVGAMFGRFFRLNDKFYVNLAVGLGLNFENIRFPDVPADAKWQAEFQDIFLSLYGVSDHTEGNYKSILMIYHLNVFYKI